MYTSLLSQCQLLLESVAAQYATGKAHGSMSPSIYDTAWLSMLRKPEGKINWLFPECFDFILRSQMMDGSWEAYRSEADGILNTAAALLSLKRHLRETPDNQDLVFRSRKAELTLNNLLNNWDISSTDQVGFEILIIKHLSLLEDEGLAFQFPGWETLKALRDSKVNKLPIRRVITAWFISKDAVYEGPSTLHHSLEALIGVIEFDKLKRWLGDDGSMCGSISSTVAYLMYSSTWDQEAESYLRNALEYGTGNRDGGVPCAWPTTIFEGSWVITILAEAGVPIIEMVSSNIGNDLEEALALRNGIVGFSHSAFPDADDTAKTIIACITWAFDSVDHFKTYRGERNPSFSANCNILTCLMTVKDPIPYGAQIARAASFLCEQVLSGCVKEKWHSHDLYWMMLLSQAFVKLDQITREEGVLRNEIFTRAPHLRQHIPMISLQILTKVLGSQELNGSWDNICEVTAYAVLTLSSIIQLPWIQQLQDDGISASINRGKSYLHLHRKQWNEGHYLWIEKVTCASNILSEAYCLAASITRVVSSHQPQPSHAFQLPAVLTRGIQGAMSIISRTPLFAKVETCVVKAAESLTAYVYLSLQHQPLDIFPRSGDEQANHKYQIFTPAIWAACSMLHDNAISLSLLCEMVQLSRVMYQVDIFMESAVERNLGKDLPRVGVLIRDLFRSLRAPSHGKTNGQGTKTPIYEGLISGDSSAFEDVKSTLTRLIKYVLHHQAVLKSPERLQRTLAYELESLILAHVTQAEDNQRFALQDSGSTPFPMARKFPDPGQTFHSWIRNTSSTHTSSPFAFIFFNCLISKPKKNAFKTARSAYLAEDLSRHLANHCRMYNDHGSIARDKDEANLNSVNFPEFHSKRGVGPDDEKDIKDQLVWIAEYERDGFQNAAAKLEAELGDKNLMDALKVFIDVTDLFGQIYVQKDLSHYIK
ncbi:Ent-kaurene synthase [Annulohypoxylon nitens]|nr:Ent-kaurene synthase [Annulohypoxylon nitens]